MDIALQQDIVKTLAYFDIFNCPLNREELYRFLWSPSQLWTYDQFVTELQKKEGLSTAFESLGGYYFLSGRSEIVATRERRVWYVEKKLKIAKHAAFFLKFIPGVKAFFVCNQIQVGVNKKSDIDVLIVVAPQRLYLTRLFVTVVLGFFRLRRGKRKITDRICLSFYVTENALDFSSLKMGDTDIYFVYWLATLLPVYDPHNYLEKIFQANSWATTHVPHGFHSLQLDQPWHAKDSAISTWVKKMSDKILSGKFGTWLEIKCKNMQLKHMEGNTQSVQNKDSRVVVSDTILKFHENDRRERFKGDWEKKWQTSKL